MGQNGNLSTNEHTAPLFNTIGFVYPSHPLLENLFLILSDILSRRGYHCLRLRHEDQCTRELRVVIVFGPSHTIDNLHPILKALKARFISVLFWLIEPIPPIVLDDVAKSAAAILNAQQNRRGLYRFGFVRKFAVRRVCAELSKHIPVTGIGLDDLWLTYICRNYTWLKEVVATGLVSEVIVSLRYRSDVLLGSGIPSDYVPMGYHRHWGYRMDNINRDVDVLFLGEFTRQRKVILEDVKVKLSQSGWNMMVVSGGCFGDERTELLNRAKILLVVLKTPWEFPGMRMLMGLGCGALVVSEAADDSHPYRPGQHFVMVEQDQLANTLLYYLNHDDERRRIAEQGYAFITRNLTMESTIIPEIERLAGNTAMQHR